MHSAPGIANRTRSSTTGSSMDHGAENSPVKKTEPVNRTTRNTSDNTSSVNS